MQREITAHEKSLGSQNVCTVAVLKRPHFPSLPAGAPPPPLISTPISTADAVAAVERLVRRHPVLKRVHGFSSSQRHQFLMDGTSLFDAANHVTLVGFDNPEEDQWPLTLDLSSQWHTRLQASAPVHRFFVHSGSHFLMEFMLTCGLPMTHTNARPS